ncbi:MAG: hypothetical protein Kow0047_24720 [Anaerolineae bacterium]
MTRWWWVIALAILASCTTPAASPIDAAFRLSPARPVVGPLHVEVTLSERGTPVLGADVELEATMSHAGMVPIFARMQELGDGRYAAEIDLTMAGDWILITRARLPDGRQVEHHFDVRGVQPHTP